jgi:hypothetical protein
MSTRSTVLKDKKNVLEFEYVCQNTKKYVEYIKKYVEAVNAFNIQLHFNILLMLVNILLVS